MTELLQYSFEVVGVKDIERALASLENMFVHHNQRMKREFGGSVVGSRSSASAGTGTAVAREAKAAIAAEERERIASARRVAKAGEQLDRQRAQALYRDFQQQEATQKRAALARADFVKSTFGSGISRVGRVANAVGTTGLALTGIGGAGLAASAVSQATDIDERARRLVVASTGAGEQAQYTPEQLKRRFAAVSGETGISQEGLAGAAQTFVAKTGDLKTPIEALKVFATVAQATGSSIEDVASTAADLSQKFDIKTTQGMADALSVLAFQGKKGAFELKDMANTFPEMAAAAQRAGLSGVGGMKILGGLAQISRQSTGSGAEASTALQMMMTQLTNKAAKLKSGEALGGQAVNVFEGGDATKKARDLPTVLAEIISKSHGNQSQLSELFDVRGIRAVSPMIGAFHQAYDTTKGTNAQREEAGKKAVLAMIDDAANASGSYADVQKDSTEVMKSFNVQLERVTSMLKAGVASELMPEIMQLAAELPSLIDPVRTVAHVLVKLAETLLDHPLASLGVILATAIAVEVVKAKLGDVITNALKGAAAGAGGAAGALPGTAAAGAGGFLSKPSMGGALGAAGTGAAIGISLATAIFTAGVVNIETSEANMNQAGQDLNMVRNAGVDDIESVRATLKKQRDRVFKLEDPSFTQKASNLVSYGTSRDEVQLKTQKSFEDEMQRKLVELENMKTKQAADAASAKALSDAAAELSTAAGKLAGKDPNRGNAPSPVKPG